MKSQLLLFAVISLLVILNLSNRSTSTSNYAGVDASVGCAENPPTKEDAISTWDGKILSIFANPLGKAGMFVNAIVPQKLEFSPAVYTITGQFRIPKDARNEHISINVQWFDNDTERYSELFYTVNTYSPLYQWVWTRNKLDEQIKLFEIPHDSQWHTFTLISDHINHITKRIQVDQLYRVLNLEMGRVSRKHENAIMILYETHNQYPVCGSALVTKGMSEWRNIEVKK